MKAIRKHVGYMAIFRRNDQMTQTLYICQSLITLVAHHG